jgi:hypothetical protein
VWTNERVAFKVALTREVLTKLTLGVADALEARKARQLTVEVGGGSRNGDRLLGALFPKKRFLIMDYW